MQIPSIARPAQLIAAISMAWIAIPLLFTRIPGIGSARSAQEQREERQLTGTGDEHRGSKRRFGVFSSFASGYARGLRAGKKVADGEDPAARPNASSQPRTPSLTGSKRDYEPGVKGFLKQLKKEFDKDDVGAMAAALSYTTFLALFPFFIFLASLASFITDMLDIENPTERILDAIGDALPASAADVISTQVGNVIDSSSGSLLSIGAIGALWAASGAMRMLMKSMNKAYDVPESRPFYRKYPLSLGMTLLSSVFFIAAAVLLFVGQFWARDILEWMGFTGGWAATLVAWARWPVVILLVLGAVGFLYWAAPNIGIPFKFISLGAVSFVIVWLLATLGFIFYVSNFGSYNATYGALGGVVVLLIWIYISSLILLLGAEINAMINERTEPEKMEERRHQKQAEAESHGSS